MAQLPHGMMGVDDLDLPAPTEGEKVSKENAAYLPVSEDPATACSACKYFVEPDRCQIVTGAIDPAGVSQFFTPMAQNAPVTSPEGAPLEMPEAEV